MSTAISSFSPITSCFSRLAYWLPCASKTENVFERVYVNKLDDNGQVKTYDIKDKDGKVVRQTQVLSYIEDTTTGNIYLDESQNLIRFKCAVIFLGLPLYTAGMMVWQFSK